MEQPTRETIRALVQRMLDPDTPEEERDALAERLDESVVYPGGASILVEFWENHFGDRPQPPVEEIVDRIVSYRPIRLPGRTE